MGESVVTKIADSPTNETVVLEKAERYRRLFQELGDLSEKYNGTSENVSIEIKYLTPRTYAKKKAMQLERTQLPITIVISGRYQGTRGKPVDYNIYTGEVNKLLDQYEDVIVKGTRDVGINYKDKGKDCIDISFSVYK